MLGFTGTESSRCAQKDSTPVSGMTPVTERVGAGLRSLQAHRSRRILLLLGCLKRAFRWISRCPTLLFIPPLASSRVRMQQTSAVRDNRVRVSAGR